MRILLTRHGESEYNTQDRIGGDSPLTLNGWNYAHMLDKFIQKNISIIPNKCIHSGKIRVKQTVSTFLHRIKDIEELPILDEIDAGIAENLSYAEFKAKYPEEYMDRSKNKLHYKYPDGESYIDVINRIKSLCTTIKTNGGDIFIVAHRAIIRALISEFMKDISIEDIPTLNIPLHTIIELNCIYGYWKMRYINVEKFI